MKKALAKAVASLIALGAIHTAVVLVFFPMPSDAGDPPGEKRRVQLTVSPIADIYPGLESSYPQIMFDFRDRLYFRAQDRDHGQELWCYDGTRVELALDLRKGRRWSVSQLVGTLTDKLIFTVLTETRRRLDKLGEMDELWEFDGVTARHIEGVRTPSSSHLHPAVYKGAMYFKGIDEIHGRELWKYDGATASLVADIQPGPESSHCGNLIVFKDKLHFVAHDGEHGFEWWQFDGQTATMCPEIDSTLWPDNNQPRGSRLSPDSPGEGPLVYQDKLYFCASDGIDGFELWSWNGEEMSLAADINPGERHSFPGGLCVFKDQLYFRAGREKRASELWRFDGERAELAANGGDGAKWKSVGNCGPWGNLLMLVADDGIHGAEPWYFDGAKARMVADVLPGEEGSYAAVRVIYRNVPYGGGKFPKEGIEPCKFEFLVR
jgi:ELWxxDGT repeat protein